MANCQQLLRTIICSFELLLLARALPCAQLKAYYGFPAKKVSRKTMGLGPKEVLVVNLSSFNIWRDKEDLHPYDEYVLKLAIQGFVNRHEPMIWMDCRSYGWYHDEEEWRRYYSQTRGYVFKNLEGGLEALLRTVKRAFSGVILYNDTKNPDQLFLALNLSSLNSCLPVSKRLYEKYGAILGDMLVVARADELRA